MSGGRRSWRRALGDEGDHEDEGKRKGAIRPIGQLLIRSRWAVPSAASFLSGVPEGKASTGSIV